MRYGLVDLGSNSIRLSVYERREGGICATAGKKAMAGLAGYVENGSLTRAGIDKTCAILCDYQQALTQLRVPKMHVFATASLRNIQNRQEALEIISYRTGITPEVLSGEEEARLCFLGAVGATAEKEGVLADIGGGSTELVLFCEGRAQRLASLPVGSLSLRTRYVRGMLPTEAERRRIKRELEGHLFRLRWPPPAPGGPLIASGGTARAALRLCHALLGPPRVENQIPLADIERLVRTLRSGEAESYQALYRIVPERMFSIHPGLMILGEVMRHFSCSQVVVSYGGVREGYLLDRILPKENQQDERAKTKQAGKEERQGA